MTPHELVPGSTKLAWTGRLHMKERIRDSAPQDEEPIVELSL